MYIIKLKNEEVYFTDNVVKNDSTYEFDTTSKKGKVAHHTLAISEISELIQQEGSVDDSRKKDEE